MKALPRYLDLELYARSRGVAFTHSSNLIHALNAAVRRVEWAQRFAELEEHSRRGCGRGCGRWDSFA